MADTQEVVAASGLDRLARRFAAFAGDRPELKRKATFASFFSAVRQMTPSVCGVPVEIEDPVQPWPVWLDEGLGRELAETSVELTKIFRTLPKRFFDGRADRIAAYLGLETTTVEMLLAEPNLLHHTLCRGDFLLTKDGLKLLELNLGNLGGWQCSALGTHYLERPDVRDFLAHEGLRGSCFPSIRTLLRHVVSHALAHPLAPGPLHLLIVVSNEGATSFASHPERLYQRELLAVLREMPAGTAVRLKIAPIGEVSFPGGEVHAGGLRYHAVLEQNDTEPSREIFRAFKAGLVHSYTSPLGMILGDKRWLTLLSSEESAQRFTPEERRLLDRVIPWTRTVEPKTEAFRGDRGTLPELLRRHRQHLVLKAGQGYGGSQVHVGRAHEPHRWDALCEEALAGGGWIVQEYLEPLMPELQAGEEGTAPYRIVWGLFVFGEAYGGAYLRLAPESFGAVVNVARGARVGVALDVRPA